jgi:exoribonuclease R
MNVSFLMYKNSKYFVNDYEVNINDSNALIGDVVKCVDNNIVEIIQRTNIHIVGILKLTSRVKYGCNKRGVPIYIFNPYHNKYPKFLVCSKLKNKRDIFCSISFNKYDKNKLKLFGKLEKVIGEVKNYNNEINYILAQYYLDLPRSDLLIKKYNLFDKIKKDIEKNEKLQLEKEDYKVISIDPIGCKDVDDAFHFIEKSDYYEIGIHISDVMFYLDKELNNIAKLRLFTIYYDNGKNNMFPDIYSENLMSLIETKKRRVLSVIYKYDKINGKLIETNIKRSIITNCSQFTYEYVDELLRKNRYKCGEEKIVLDICKFMETKLGLNINSHNLIEYFMIETNKYIGELLYKNIGSKLIIRKHSNGDKDGINLNIDNELELISFLKLKMMKKATYDFASNDENDNYHYGLNLKNYVHFTSPIRRYNDILIHSLLYNLIENNNEIYNINIDDIILEEMNNKEQNINRCQRKLDRLKIIKNFEQINKNERIIENGYISDIDNKYIYVYIPKYKIEEKIRIVEQKFKELYEVELQNKNLKIFENGILKNEFIKYQKINIEIIPFINEELFQNKIKISII